MNHSQDIGKSLERVGTSVSSVKKLLPADEPSALQDEEPCIPR